jgi:hypothetical protein
MRRYLPPVTRLAHIDICVNSVTPIRKAIIWNSSLRFLKKTFIRRMTTILDSANNICKSPAN